MGEGRGKSEKGRNQPREWALIKPANWKDQSRPKSAVQVPSWLLAEVLCEEEKLRNKMEWRRWRGREGGKLNTESKMEGTRPKCLEYLHLKYLNAEKNNRKIQATYDFQLASAEQVETCFRDTDSTLCKGRSFK